MSKLSYKKKSKGFTLVETLVAIFILAMAITSAMTVAQSSLQASFYSRDRISAYFLAGEAIEMIKNKRDENGIKNFEDPAADVYWLDGIASWAPDFGPCGEDDGATDPCGVDAEQDIIESCSSPSPDMNGCVLFKNTSGIIGHEDGAGSVQTKFIREVYMERINDNEAKITVRVSWAQRTFEISEHIFNWHPLSDLE